MGYKKLLVLALFLASHSYAFEEGFFSQNNLPIQPNGLDRAMGASVKLQSPESSCSGAFISPQGHYLTAAHCVFSCIQGTATLYQEIDYGSGEDYPLQKVLSSTPLENSQRLRCPVLSLPELGLHSPEIIYIGRGVMNADERLLKNIPPDSFSALLEFDEDFAILKFDVSSLTSPPDCVPARFAPLKTDERIWMVGFPGSTLRRKDGKLRDYLHNSDGKSEYVTYGKVLKGFEDTEFWKTVPEVRENPANVLALYNQPENFLSDIDGYDGNSGSVMIDQDGKAIGVFSATASAVPDAIFTQYVQGSGIGIRLSYVVDLLRTNLPGEFETIFSCSSSE